jgi:hypothetical protein
MESIMEQVKKMSAGQVLEAAEMVLPELLDISSLEEVTSRLTALSGLPENEIVEVVALARDAAANSPREISDVLRLVLLDTVSGEGECSDEIRRKAASVGHKQIVLGPEIYYLGALLIAAYLAYKYGGPGFLGHEIVLNLVTKENEHGKGWKPPWCSGGRA